MKTILSLIAFGLFACNGYSQSESSVIAFPSKHMRGDFLISASPNLMLKTDFGNKFAGGAKMQFFIGKNFSVDADLVIGSHYHHFGPGLLGIPLAFISSSSISDPSDFTTSLIMAVIVLSSVEHLSYHIPVTENFEISPFVSFLRFREKTEITEDSQVDSYEEICFASGIQLNKYFGKFSISPYYDFSVGYSSHKVIIGLGIYCGIYFNTKILDRALAGK